MKVSVLFLFLVGYVFGGSDHDVPHAVFKIYQSKNRVKMEVTFDIHALRKSSGIRFKEMTRKRITTYLNENMNFKFDGVENTLWVKDMDDRFGHLTIKAQFRKKVKRVDEIAIENRCLLDIEHHSNLMKLSFNGEDQDFRMNADLTEICATYREKVKE